MFKVSEEKNNVFIKDKSPKVTGNRLEVKSERERTPS